MNNKFALFGNPLNHSKSQYIHKLFSNQTNIKYKYINFCVDKLNFEDKFLNFIKNEGNGANITTPFKEIVIKYCNKLTIRSSLSESVNVIKKDNNGDLIGDNTDGLGIIFDLKRLNYINKNYNVLIIGSGGSVKGIIPDISLNVKNIIITNRTIEKSFKIKKFFIEKNILNVNVLDISDLESNKFNLIINATSSGIFGEVPKIPSCLINKNVICYDLFYDLNKETPFIYWCKYNGSIFNSDGLGMLISQAAYSFYLWYNIMPDVSLILNKIRKNKNLFK